MSTEHPKISSSPVLYVFIVLVFIAFLLKYVFEVEIWNPIFLSVLLVFAPFLGEQPLTQKLWRVAKMIIALLIIAVYFLFVMGSHGGWGMYGKWYVLLLMVTLLALFLGNMARGYEPPLHEKTLFILDVVVPICFVVLSVVFGAILMSL